MSPHKIFTRDWPGLPASHSPLSSRPARIMKLLPPYQPGGREGGREGGWNNPLDNLLVKR